MRASITTNQIFGTNPAHAELTDIGLTSIYSIKVNATLSAGAESVASY